MTKEEAIKYFKRHLDLYCVDGISREAEEMAIQALSQEPTNTWSIKDVADTFKKHGLIREQEPCDDAISRDAVYSILNEYHIGEEEIESAMDECQNLTVNAITSDVSLLPSVTQKSGEWKHEQFPNFKVAWFCNKCGGGTYHKTNYCPNCGAKMESEDKE